MGIPRTTQHQLQEIMKESSHFYLVFYLLPSTREASPSYQYRKMLLL